MGGPIPAEPTCAPPPLAPNVPARQLPPGTCDTHVHVYGPQARYPLSPARNYTPHVCMLDAYRKVMAALGISRAVLVQPSVYGTDNSALLDALREGGPAFRGVAVPSPQSTDAQLAGMHALGVRGIRLNLVNPAVLAVSDALALCRRVAPMGWHLQLQLELARGGVDALRAVCQGTELPVVVDHMGRPPPSVSPVQECHRVLLELLAQGRCWVKLSAPYRVSAAPPPHADLRHLIRALADAHPGRVLWASDWPHPEQAGSTPDAAALADLLREWLPDDAALRQACVDNPARLYDFPEEFHP